MAEPLGPSLLDFPGGSDGKSICLQWGRTQVRSLGREDPLEKEMATHFSTLAWKIPWTEELGGLQSTGRKELDTTERLHFHLNILWHCLSLGLE